MSIIGNFNFNRSGAEGNMYGMLLGRESIKEPILYASSESHLSIYKASVFFKIELKTIKAQKSVYFEFLRLVFHWTK